LNVLAIETATQVCGVALVNGEELIGEYRLNIKNVHVRKLGEAIDRLLTDANLSVERLDGIAVSIGPGSFTGLRIGLSTAKGMALAYDTSLVTVSTLDALAGQAPVEKGSICAMLRARADEHYCALYRRANFADTPLEPAAVLKTDELEYFIPDDAIVIGNIPQSFRTKTAKKVKFAPLHLCYPDAYSIARLGLKALLQGDTADIDRVEPLYLQEFIAGKRGADKAQR
jgi:tRNA threonylcarbamoyladenosine biosynthesis protein TsaB